MRFRFNEKKTAQAAAHMLKLAGGKMNYMLLIKLLFLADRVSLIKNEQPITGAWIVSMKKGPVLSEVLDLVNEGSESEGPWAKYVSAPAEYDVKLKVSEPETGELSKWELKVLGEVFKRFGGWDKWKLVKWLHDNIPEWTDPKGSMLTIEYAEILRKNDFSEKDIQRIRDDAEVLWQLQSLGR